MSTPESGVTCHARTVSGRAPCQSAGVTVVSSTALSLSTKSDSARMEYPMLRGVFVAGSNTGSTYRLPIDGFSARPTTSGTSVGSRSGSVSETRVVSDFGDVVE